MRTNGDDTITITSPKNILEEHIWSITVDTKNLVHANSVAATANTNPGALDFSNYNESNVEWSNELNGNDHADGAGANANAKADDNDDEVEMIYMDPTENTTPLVDLSTTLAYVRTQPFPPASFVH